MGLYTFTGRLTNYQRRRLTASREAELVVVARQPGFGQTGLLSTIEIPVTVDPDTGEFSVRLEASSGVYPEAEYELRLDYIAAGGNPSHDVWARFRAPAENGNIGELSRHPTPAWAIAYSNKTPEEAGVTNGLYIDLSVSPPMFYGPKEGRI